MDQESGYTVEVTGLSSKATEKTLYDFFSFSGTIENIEMVRSGEYGCTAYVTFQDSYSQETATLLSGATILDDRVCITRWGSNADDLPFWNMPARNLEEETDSSQQKEFMSNAGEAVSVAQEVVKTMLALGYVAGRDALTKAKAFNESHRVSAFAAEKVTELNQTIGITDKLGAGVEAVKSVDEKYHVSDLTKSAISATGRTAAAAATTVINSSYFSKGAIWLSGALNQAAKVAADLGSSSSHNGAQQ